MNEGMDEHDHSSEAAHRGDQTRGQFIAAMRANGKCSCVFPIVVWAMQAILIAVAKGTKVSQEVWFLATLFQGLLIIWGLYLGMKILSTERYCRTVSGIWVSLALFFAAEPSCLF